jgi:hypothetical protein
MSEKMKITIFVNKDKKEKTHPDFSGSIKDDSGKILHNVILWKNKPKNGGAEYFAGYVVEPKKQPNE